MARAKSWQMLKKERVRLRKLVVEWLDEHAVEDVNAWCLQYRLATKVGELQISLHGDEGDERADIFTRFMEPKRGKALVFNSNPYSGKWNFHFGRWAADAAFAHFKSAMARVIEEKRDGETEA